MAEALIARTRSLLVVTRKFVALTAVPSGVVTRIGPVVAEGGTVARISVEETTVKFGALVPLNDTLLTLKKLVPRMVTSVPTGPSVGEKLVIFGRTRKVFVLMMIPPGVMTVNGPVVALVGTVVVSLFDALTEKFANVALNNTAVTPVKFAPVMTTLVPTTPLVGVKLVSRGGT